jgi:hypothetical protein
MMYHGGKRIGNKKTTANEQQTTGRGKTLTKPVRLLLLLALLKVRFKTTSSAKNTHRISIRQTNSRSLQSTQ